MAATLLLAIGSAAWPSHAAPLELGDQPYPYRVVDQDVATALREFGSNLGLKVEISSEVKGRIVGTPPAQTALGFLDQVTRQHQLDWYYDGRTLFITAGRQAQTRLFLLGSVSYARLSESLAALGVTDQRYPLQSLPNSDVAYVNGPPRLITLVEQTLAALTAEAEARPKATRPGRSPPAPPNVLTVMRGEAVTVLKMNHGP